MSALLLFENFGFTYANGAVPALRDINLSIEPGSFTLLCGPSGCGKSTLLRLAVPRCAPVGSTVGTLTCGLPDERLGLVMQVPDNGLVHRTLIDDLVFSLENAAVPRAQMQARLAETVGYFGLEPLLHRSPDTLSGGQKQLASLAATLMMRPQLLVLDEPTAQLDPLAARDFLAMLQRLHRDFNVTVLMSEHRLDDVLPLADRLVVMRDGTVTADGAVADVLDGVDNDALPTLPRLSKALGCAVALTPPQAKLTLPPVGGWPTSVRDDFWPRAGDVGGVEAALTVRDVFFGYEKNRPVLQGADLTVDKGRITALLGGNGCGKSTLLRLCAGLEKPQQGKIAALGRVGYLMQQRAAFVLHDTVAKELNHAGAADPALVERCGLTPLLDKHPFDLSAGQQLMMILVSLLTAKPDILLLDEPTSGLDRATSMAMAALLRDSGVTVLAATHDVEWAALVADCCCHVFDGRVTPATPTRTFFARQWLAAPAVWQAFPPGGDGQ